MATARPLRDTLIDQALAMLDAGEHDLSLRAVARSAGVSAMAPYRHFPDKAALLRAAADRGFAALDEALRAADARGSRQSGADALVEQGLAYVGFAIDRPALFRLMFTSVTDPECVPQPPVDGTAYAVLAARVASLVAEDARTTAVTAWALVHGLAMLALDRRLPAEQGVFRPALVLFAAGLTKRGSEASASEPL